MTRFGSFDEYLHDLLKRRGITQTQLASYINASPPAMVDWLAGKRRPRPEFIWRIAVFDRQDFLALMRLADWIPVDEEVPVATPMPSWLNRMLPLFNELSAAEGEVLAMSARALLELREATAAAGAPRRESRQTPTQPAQQPHRADGR